MSFISIIILSLIPLSKMERAGSHSSSMLPPKYLLYDVNYSEGFNLRRDVYMRLAVFMKHFLTSSGGEHWHLVLPPWYKLYHWRSTDYEYLHSNWSNFFDLESMKRYIPVVEMHEFLEENRNGEIDVVYALQNYKDAFSDENWTWKEKWDFEECSDEHKQNYKKIDGHYKGWFWGLENVRARDVMCVSFQGHAGGLKELLEAIDDRVIMVDRAEVVLHDRFGDSEYWKCRRSMRFAKHLMEEAQNFRKKHFNSTDLLDKAILPDRWENEKIHRTAIGGNYLAVHLRRRDFVRGRSSELPSIEFAAKVIENKLKELELKYVFIASDAPEKEIQLVKNFLHEFNVHTYKPDAATRKRLMDGGIAIVDQIICSYARYFIGSYESTFSFRIHEEREILGFPPNTTFNRFCPTEEKCSQPSQWLIYH